MFRKSRFALAAGLLLAAGIMAAPSVAEARTSTACGSFYTVRTGDTLFRIADRAYSNGRLYTKIFQANRDLLPNVESVEVGAQLLIPCLDGTGPATRREAFAPVPGDEAAVVAVQTGMSLIAVGGFAEATDPIETAAPFVHVAARVDAVPFGTVAPLLVAEPAMLAEPIKVAEMVETTAPFETIEQVEIARLEAAFEPVAAAKNLRILSGGGFAPYADKLLPAGGMVTDLIVRGAKNVAPDRELDVSFINDWQAHLETLLPGDAFDVSYPWVKPDCSAPEGLDETSQALCANFEFSNPFFEMSVGYYTRVGDPLVAAADPARLGTVRICRPEGQFQFGPNEATLAASNITIETQPTVIDCLTRLVAGRVDIVNLIKSESDMELGQFGAAGRVAEIEGLATTLTLHAVVAKSSPNGRDNLALINQGLATLMASGEWFEVVVRHRSERVAELY